jgi:hypothetical protein
MQKIKEPGEMLQVKDLHGKLTYEPDRLFSSRTGIGPALKGM